MILFVGCSIIDNDSPCIVGNNTYDCVPFKSYEGYNKCITPCTNKSLKTKTKLYKPEDNKWIRPRPYAYP
jgi:hypothetical protein